MWSAPGLPPMPEELADGALCARHPEPDLWTSRLPSDRARAQLICQRCPVKALCAAWSLSLPAADTAVWGGMGASQRVARKRQRAAASP
jgi:hypothetical protein